MWSDESKAGAGVSGKPTFGETYYNDGSWSTSGQKFTATLPGLYSFTMTATKLFTSDYLGWSLQHRNSSGAMKNEPWLTLNNEDRNPDTASLSVLWQISARDTIAVEHETGTAFCDTFWPCVLSAFRVN